MGEPCSLLAWRWRGYDGRGRPGAVPGRAPGHSIPGRLRRLSRLLCHAASDAPTL
ncbi:unnamed protein product [Prorocentrum cordatum]|uniref:Uncharacterized protein n=1 Tax=Prorocentrum cordatum TaxID=2364126 RepID=A0ABN9SP39_9DINO|nr:unnamed protein product [Polarella glacialis]